MRSVTTLQKLQHSSLVDAGSSLCLWRQLLAARIQQVLQIRPVLGNGREGDVTVTLNKSCGDEGGSNPFGQRLNFRDARYADAHKNIVGMNNLRKRVSAQVSPDYTQGNSDGLRACRAARGTPAGNHPRRRQFQSVSPWQFYGLFGGGVWP